MIDYVEERDDFSEILITAEEIQTRVAEIGQAISRDYRSLNPLLIGVLKGVVLFMADLLRQISIPVEVDFLAVSAYSPQEQDQGFVRLVKDLDIPLMGRRVLFVEDVIDTGLTLSYLLRNLRTRAPASIDVCVLFNKPAHRLIDYPLKYKGFDLPDRFVAGYGLDYRERYRHLPFVGILRPEVLENKKPAEGFGRSAGRRAGTRRQKKSRGPK
ncbi:MAG: hypoxanthine phosphoribosyltransferase [Chloroflexi bacterium]|nr:hypoxanthine phosphoribosyltransferase [Chloroflexota bacterium]MCL5951492.1 hypoxanthine phosphoribosyltransferase [Chloroflexota bacterium]